MSESDQTSQVGQAIRNHHRELMRTLDGYVQALVDGRPEASPAGLAAFLVAELAPHAAGEDRHLYPAVEPLVCEHGSATATMSVDHEYIGNAIVQIGQLADQLESAEGETRRQLSRQLARLALQLEAVMQVHLAKEEQVYLPLFEAYLSPQEQARVLDGMHDAYEGVR
jgi:iron-sulfur cluster repair protein YtfE (RIC family)